MALQISQASLRYEQQDGFEKGLLSKNHNSGDNPQFDDRWSYVLLSELAAFGNQLSRRCV